MPDTFQSVVIGGVAGLVSSLITHFSTRAKIRLDVAAVYDKTLQENRFAAYTKLWAMLELLARYGREVPITHKELSSVSSETRTWYFKVGGIYLTQSSRTPYFNWKKQMQLLLDNEEFKNQPDMPIPDKTLEAVISAASTLRTSLSDDIGTKQLSRL